MILTGGDISKIDPNVVKKVEQAESEEGYVATVTLQTINDNIFLCNVVVAKPGTDVVAFTSLNLYQNGEESMVFNMQDGKTCGFEVMPFAPEWTKRPAGAEEFASYVLHDLFVLAWG